MQLLHERMSARELVAMDGVRLWSVELLQPADVVEQLVERLSLDERRRALALRRAPERRRFVVARAMLRSILAECTGIAGEDLTFSYGTNGKPSLDLPGPFDPPFFNVSHSRDLALVAVSPAHEVGVDVEWVAGSSAIENIVRRYFSHPERTKLDAAPDAVRRRIFFRIWVRKEAYLKGRGEGISQRIQETDFSLLALGDERDAGIPEREQDEWLVRDLTGLPGDYVASLAVARRAP
ncbi:MAG: 4'-phosphopantetheinyl transferase superfamily protein [Gemmatimonadaceae bacterium]